ncbi:MAG: Plug domain-containing protein [Fidelibacterota bacterium]|nr:MAG: Plug domain-containing protein [Candidatus Neomarinimicrobiota bacterium]
MKSILLLLLILSGPATRVRGADDIGASPDRKVITAEMIQAAGLIRIGDVLRLADQWNVNSTDGYTWKASVNNLSTFQSQTWVVILDGQKIDLETFDVVNLNMLPVSLDRIDSIEVVSLPQIRDGEFTGGGLIHIHTSKPASGISFIGSIAAGNETGDPGPYLYTEYNTPNIDKIGMDQSVTVDIGIRNWYARAYLIRQLHTFTDLALRQRIITIMPDWPGMDRIAAACRIGREMTLGKQELFAGYSHASTYMLFFKPLGREFAVDYLFPHIGANGIFSVPGDVDIIYRIKYSANILETQPNYLDLDFDWSLSNLNANVESIFKGSDYLPMVGVGLDRRTLKTGYQLAEDSYAIGKVYGKISFQLSDFSHQNMSAMVAISNRRAAIKGALTSNWFINSEQQVKTMLSYSQRLLEEGNSLWYWSEQGYDLLSDSSVDYSISGPIDKFSQLAIDVMWTGGIGKNFVIEMTGSCRMCGSLYLERLSYQYDSQDCSFSSPVEVHADQEGQIIGASAAINHRPGPQLKQRFYYSYRTAVGGDYVFRDLWESIPAHKVSYQITYAPVKNFSLWAMLRYFSSSYWIDYQNIGSQYCPYSAGARAVYSPTVRDATVIDLQAQKWFWRRRLIGSLLLRNILNQDFRYHPIGASFDLSLFIQIKVLFGP